MLTIALMELAIREVEALGLDPDEFRAFYDDALPKVYGYFLHRTGGTVSVAEDLTQETFLATVAELKKGRRPDTPTPWIFGIARHKLLDHYRRQDRIERTVDRDAELDQIPAPADSEDARDRAVTALADVPSSQRAALVLCYVDGFSAAEAAKLLGTSTAAVNSLLQRARATFRHVYLEASA